MHEFSLKDDPQCPQWKHTRANITIGEKKVHLLKTAVVLAACRHNLG